MFQGPEVRRFFLSFARRRPPHRRRVTSVLALACCVVLIAVPSFATPGDLDSAFGAQGKIIEQGARGWDVVMDGDKIVVAADSGLRRYTSAGASDPTFGNGGKVDAPTGPCSAKSVARQSDGKFVTGGCFNGDFVVTRYTKRGLVDPTFGTGGIALAGFSSNWGAEAIAIQPDGKIVVAGIASACCPNAAVLAIARYLPQGTLDTSFSGDGRQTTAMPAGWSFTTGDDEPAATSLVIQANGKIAVAGTRRLIGPAEDSDVVVVRYDAAGNLDPVWGGTGIVVTDLGAVEEGTGIAQQADGKIVVAGTASPDSFPDNFLALRYKADGSLDPGFGSGGVAAVDFGSSGDEANEVAVQPDGKIVLAGSAGISRFALARLDPVGTLDAGFGAEGKVTTDFGYFGTDFGKQFINAVTLQPDGKIVATGALYGLDIDSKTLGVARYLVAGAAPACTVMGTSGSDVLGGSPYDDVICAGGGDDFIQAGGGNDIIFAGNGNDTVSGQGGDDKIFGGIGSDILNGNDGLDTVYGGDGNDQINGGPYRDAMYGEAGADRLSGGGGPDYFSGGAGADILEGQDSQPDDSLDGGAGGRHLQERPR